MEDESIVKLIYHSPTGPGVWYAPDTLLWAGVLLLAPAVAVLLIRAAWALIMYLLRNAPEEPASDSYEGRSFRLALAYPWYRFSFVVFGYALLLLAACSFAFNSSLRPYTGPSVSEPARLVGVTPGLPAASAMLIIPAAALFFAGLIVVIGGPNQGAALKGTGQLSVLWLFSASVGLGTAAIGYAAIRAPAACWQLSLFAAAAVCALGFVRYYLPVGGQSVRDKVRAATRGFAHSIGEEASREVGLEAEGLYLGVAPVIYWGRLALALVGPGLVFELGPMLLMRGSGARLSPHLVVEAAFVLGSGAIVGGLVYLFSATQASRVRWSREGLEVVWYTGPPRTFAWDDLVELRLAPEAERSPRTAWVRTKGGKRFRALGNRSGYDGLAKVLEARVWGREAESLPGA